LRGLLPEFLGEPDENSFASAYVPESVDVLVIDDFIASGAPSLLSRTTLPSMSITRRYPNEFTGAMHRGQNHHFNGAADVGTGGFGVGELWNCTINH